MKNKTVKALALLMTVTTVSMMGASSIYASDMKMFLRARWRSFPIMSR